MQGRFGGDLLGEQAGSDAAVGERVEPVHGVESREGPLGGRSVDPVGPADLGQALRANS